MPRPTGWCDGRATAKVEPTVTEGELAKRLYRGDRQAFIDRLRLDLASARGRAQQDDKALIEAGGYFRLLGSAGKWQKPLFPLRGGDLSPLGVEGARLGALLKALESDWVDSGFSLERDALLERAADSLESQGFA